ncbi:hypothetical protein [Actinospongicola halichondriae]|uniref:hypothetical protein n=1 Tax=Actinospongicola halichondriae TaxID=3236844 RepID=UPI003D43F665
MTTDADAKAVQNYLTYLRDPSALIDEVAIKAAEEAVTKAQDSGDVLAEAKARAEREAASKVDASDFRSAFIKSVKAWSDANKVSAQVLSDMGVDAAVLRDAGFDDVPSSKGRQKRSSGSRTRVSSDDVKAHVLGLSDAFTLKAVADQTGASAQTVRKVVEDLVDDGKATKGDDPDHQGRGRAPKLYKVTK